MVITRRLHEEAVLLIAPWIYAEDLLSLMRTCKLFHEVGLPLLYEELRWTESYGHIARKARSLRLLFRSVVRNPDLLPLIKHIEFTGPELISEMGLSSPPRAHLHRAEICDQRIELEEDIVSALENLVRSSGLATDEWFPLLCRGQVETLIPLLLVQAPALKSLRVDARFHTFSRLLGTMLSQVVYPKAKDVVQWTGPFSKLEKVEYVSDSLSRRPNYRVEAGYDHIQALLYLPSIQYINASIEESSRAYHPLRVRQPQAPKSTLRTLVLRTSEPNLDIMEDLLMGSPCLTKFIYLWWGDLENRLDEVLFKVNDFLPALAPVMDSLQDLRISIRLFQVSPFADRFTGGYGSITESFRDLSEFKKLERFQIPLVALMGGPESADFKMPVLPASIRDIFVTNDTYKMQSHQYSFRDVIGAFRDFLSDWRSRVPNLKKIAIKTTEDNDSWFRYDDLEEELFTSMCEEAGVECEFRFEY